MSGGSEYATRLREVEAECERLRAHLAESEHRGDVLRLALVERTRERDAARAEAAELRRAIERRAKDAEALAGTWDAESRMPTNDNERKIALAKTIAATVLRDHAKALRSLQGEVR